MRRKRWDWRRLGGAMLGGKVLVVRNCPRLILLSKGLQSSFLPWEAPRKTLWIPRSGVVHGWLLGGLGDLKGYISMPVSSAISCVRLTGADPENMLVMLYVHFGVIIPSFAPESWVARRSICGSNALFLLPEKFHTSTSYLKGVINADPKMYPGKHGRARTARYKSHMTATLKKQCRASRQRPSSYLRRRIYTSRECQIYMVRTVLFGWSTSNKIAVLKTPSMKLRTWNRVSDN